MSQIATTVQVIAALDLCEKHNKPEMPLTLFVHSAKLETDKHNGLRRYKVTAIVKNDNSLHPVWMAAKNGSVVLWWDL